MSILNNALRLGCFTSSEIVALTKINKDGSFKTTALTYINKKNQERRLGRSLEKEVTAKPTSWGLALEPILFNLLGLEYAHQSQETVRHPHFDFLAGSVDGIKHDEGKTVLDYKCPWTLESFCTLVEPIVLGLEGIEAINWLRKNHDKGEDYYWQLVNNSIIHNTKYAELIVFVPYQSQLAEIKQSVDGDGKYYFINMALENELPYLPDGGYYKNISIIRFKVPAEDKNFLIQQVIKAGQLLIKV